MDSVSKVLMNKKKSPYLVLKYFFDKILSLLAIVLLSPFFIVIAIIIKLESKGPVFFKHERFGLNAKPFRVYKFRTMVQNAHEQQKNLQRINEMKGGTLFKSDRDPRITKIGKYLRKYSIDELPQLINIARGEMSFIGPRPISTPITYYKVHELNRFSVKPGLGCIWQAYFRGQTDFRMWIRTDLIYVDSISIWLDIKLFCKMLYNSILGKGAR